MSDHRRKVLENFSGTLCVDELHLGQFTLLLATDPLRDLPVAFALVGANDQDHMRRFLKNLKNWGLSPGSWSPTARTSTRPCWRNCGPTADHQLCVFHIDQGHQQADPRCRAAVADGDERRGKAGRKKKRGRKGAKSQGPPRHDGQGEIGLRVQAPASDREAPGEPHRVASATT